MTPALLASLTCKLWWLALIKILVLLPLHNMYFVKYDVTVSFLAQVSDTVAYFVFQVLVVDTVTYFEGNH